MNPVYVAMKHGCREELIGIFATKEEAVAKCNELKEKIGDVFRECDTLTVYEWPLGDCGEKARNVFDMLAKREG